MSKYEDFIIEKQHHIAEIQSTLKNKIITVPTIIDKAPGIKIMGKVIKSLLFTTDVSVIKNTNADAIIAVYPFTSQIVINRAIMEVASIPVFVGVGGGTTKGSRSVSIAFDAELNGAFGVVLNSPATNELISEMKQTLDIPIVVTIVSVNEDIEARLKSGASIINVSGGSKTIEIVKKIRSIDKKFPIIATGGNEEDTIRETIEAGANCITYTPPSAAEILSELMNKYRKVHNPD